jgi:predicted dehydrogenase
VAPGNENALRLRVYGEKGGLEWQQEEPNQLRFAPLGQAPRTLTRAGTGLGVAATHATRVPAGHPEGYLEAFAQLYADTAELLWAKKEGRAPDPQAGLVPSVEDGARGVKFIEAAVASSRNAAAWTSAKIDIG